MNPEEEDVRLLAEIQKVIQEKTDQEVIALSKISQKFDEKAIKEKKAREFLQTVQENLEKSVLPCTKAFWEQLQIDDKGLYEELITIATSLADLQKNENMTYQTLCSIKNQIASSVTQEAKKKLLDLAENYFILQDFTKAKAYFTSLSYFDPSNSYIWLAKGVTEQSLGLYDDALNSYVVTMRLDPSYTMAYLQTLECLIVKGETTKARDLFETMNTEINDHEVTSNPIYTAKMQNIKKALEQEHLLKGV